MNNPYEVLGISTQTSEEDAKNKYRKLCKMNHPDNMKTGDREKLEEVLQAWKVLQDNGFKQEKQYWGHKTLFSLKLKRRT